MPSGHIWIAVCVSEAGEPPKVRRLIPWRGRLAMQVVASGEQSWLLVDPTSCRLEPLRVDGIETVEHVLPDCAGAEAVGIGRGERRLAGLSSVGLDAGRLPPPLDRGRCRGMSAAIGDGAVAVAAQRFDEADSRIHVAVFRAGQWTTAALPIDDGATVRESHVIVRGEWVVVAFATTRYGGGLFRVHVTTGAVEPVVVAGLGAPWVCPIWSLQADGDSTLLVTERIGKRDTARGEIWRLREATLTREVRGHAAIHGFCEAAERPTVVTNRRLFGVSGAELQRLDGPRVRMVAACLLPESVLALGLEPARLVLWRQRSGVVTVIDLASGGRVGESESLQGDEPGELHRWLGGDGWGRVTGVVAFGDRIAALVEPPDGTRKSARAWCLVDPESGTFEWAQVPGMHEILLVDCLPELGLVALGRGRTGLTLVQWADGNACEVPLPDELRSEPSVSLMIGDESRVVILARDLLAVRCGNRWRIHTLAGYYGSVRVGLLSGSSLYLGAGEKEFGGAIHRVDLETGLMVQLHTSILHSNQAPTGLARTNTGEVLATFGNSSVMGHMGGVARLVGDAPERFVDSKDTGYFGVLIEPGGTTWIMTSDGPRLLEGDSLLPDGPDIGGSKSMCALSGRRVAVARGSEGVVVYDLPAWEVRRAVRISPPPDTRRADETVCVIESPVEETLRGAEAFGSPVLFLEMEPRPARAAALGSTLMDAMTAPVPTGASTVYWTGSGFGVVSRGRLGLDHDGWRSERGPVVSAKSTWIVTLNGYVASCVESRVQIVDPTGRRVTLGDEDGGVGPVCTHEPTARIAMVREDGVEVSRVVPDGLTARTVFINSRSGASGVAWLADGRRLVVTRQRGAVALLDTTTGAWETLRTRNVRPAGVAAAARADCLVVLWGDGRLDRLADGRWSSTHVGPSRRDAPVGISADGLTVIVGSEGHRTSCFGRVAIWDVARAEVAFWEGEDRIRSLAIDGSGRRFAAICGDTVAVVDATSARSRHPAPVDGELQVIGDYWHCHTLRLRHDRVTSLPSTDWAKDVEIRGELTTAVPRGAVDMVAGILVICAKTGLNLTDAEDVCDLYLAHAINRVRLAEELGLPPQDITAASYVAATFGVAPVDLLEVHVRESTMLERYADRPEIVEALGLLRKDAEPEPPSVAGWMPAQELELELPAVVPSGTWRREGPAGVQRRMGSAWHSVRHGHHAILRCVLPVLALDRPSDLSVLSGFPSDLLRVVPPAFGNAK